MYTTINSLKKYLNLSSQINSKEIIAALNTLGHEVEDVFCVLDANQNIVVGEICKTFAHPQSKKLTVCHVKVAVNWKNPLVILCGANNYQIGDKVVVAVAGAVLHNNFIIKKKEIAGVVSEGMICSLSELGYREKFLGEADIVGIHVLPANAIIGKNPCQYLNQDMFIKLKLTPNRGDCLSLVGLASELAAYFNVTTNNFTNQSDYLVFKKSFAKVSKTTKFANNTTVNLCSKTCELYTNIVLNHVKITSSPKWLQDFLRLHDVRVINNMVDLTNFILLELGVPLHAYDLAKTGDHFDVFDVSQSTAFVALNGAEFILPKHTTVIGNKTINDVFALAGISGALSTGITPATKDIVIEAANWNNVSVRQTSHHLNLYTEAGRRYSYKIDHHKYETALLRFLFLAWKLNYFESFSQIQKSLWNLSAPIQINLSIATLKFYIGFFIEQREVATYLSRLGFQCLKADMDILTVTVPTYRLDIENDIDLVEEIVKLADINKIPGSPLTITVDFKKSHQLDLVKKVHTYAISRGWNNVYNYDLTSLDIAKKFNFFAKTDFAIIQNDFSIEHKVLRLSIIPSLLSNFITNFNHLRIYKNYYEITNLETLKDRWLSLAFLISTKSFISPLNITDQKVDFSEVQAQTTALLNTLFFKISKFAEIVYQPWKDTELFHPYQVAKIYLNQTLIGVIGKINPQLKYSNFDFTKHNLYGVELNFNLISKFLKSFSNQAVNVDNSFISARFINKDFSFLIKKTINLQTVIDYLKRSSLANVYHVNLFDLFDFNKDHFSLSLKVIFIYSFSPSDLQINNDMYDFANLIIKKYDAKLRGELARK